jgi:2-polyprenyl-6-methoxyphenol hydroxylase-like FAD-dependent oxidoreductase
MMERFDVVVVGARVAGAATALLLARQGLRVVAVERARRGDDTNSTHALMRGGTALLQRWGLLERVVAAGTPAIRQTRFHYPGESSTVSIKPAAGVDALYAPRRTVLDPILVEAATAAGADVRFGVAVTDLTRDADGRVTGVVGRDRSGGAVELGAGLVVGADGRDSLVARRAGARTVRVGAGASAFVYGYWPDLPTVGYEWFYRPGGSAGLIPTNDGQVCVFAGLPAGRFADEVRGDLPGLYRRVLKEVTGAAFGRLAAEPPRRLRAFPGRPGFAPQAWGPGWALVGDAGYYVDPLSTHGMTDALRDAQLLAWAVAAAHDGEPETAAFSDFQWRRDAITGPLFGIVDQICSYGWDTPGIRRLLLQVSSAMSDEVEAILAVET